MPLKFAPGGAVYDPDRRMVRFLARDESPLVRCAVTRGPWRQWPPFTPSTEMNRLSFTVR